MISLSMQGLTAAEQPSAGPGNLKTPPRLQRVDTAAGSSHQLRDRRRERPLLSCTFCRSRNCNYAPSVAPKNKVSVGGRIQQLETLVRTLIQQQQQQQQQVEYASQNPADTPEGMSTTPQSQHAIRHASGTSPQSTSGDLEGLTSFTSVDEGTGTPSPIPGPVSVSQDCSASPAPSDNGSLRPHSNGANYVGSVHWAAVLDSISEIKNHFEKEEEAKLIAASDYMPRGKPGPGPRLFYEPVLDSKDQILASIPPRPALDRIIAQYFNMQNNISLPVLHSNHFLRQYENFWQDPNSTSLLWIGLLFSVIALTLQLQRMKEDPLDPDMIIRIHMFRERTIQCLVLGEFTRGEEHVLETIINYLGLEILLCKEADIGLWLVLGTLVQLALGLGYHRDAQNFANLSPFAGEMRRRVFSVIVQLDLRVSIQMGLPRLLKLHQCDTADPRNLLDTDFDDSTVELPTSRPETEVTPVLYVLAKNRIDRMSDVVNAFVTEPRERPYAEVIELQRKLQDAEASLPPIFKWQTLSQSLMVPPQIIVHRMWLHLSRLRLSIWLHRKYIAPSYADAQYKYSRAICVKASIEVLEFQHLVDEETRPDGLLYPVRFMTTTFLGQFGFLLAMSILSYCIQLAKNLPEFALDEDTDVRIYELLHNSYRIWLRQSTVSREARQATDHLSLLLGLGRQEAGGGGMLAENAAKAGTSSPITSDFTTAQDTTLSLDQVNWDDYQDRFANIPLSGAFGADFWDPPVPMPDLSSAGGAYMADLLSTSNTKLDI